MRAKLFQTFETQLNELSFGKCLIVELDSIKNDTKNGCAVSQK
jgi:hypothetical protein